MIDTSRKQMSAILKEMALTVLDDPESFPSSEAASAALLLSHVAWQRANGDNTTLAMYRLVLAEMQKSKPDLWQELKSADHEALITDLVHFKKRNYPQDKRRVVACGTYNNKVRAEWTEGKSNQALPDAKSEASDGTMPDWMVGIAPGEADVRRKKIIKSSVLAGKY